MGVLRAALAVPALRISLTSYLAFVIVEEASWLGILLYAHDVGGVAAAGFVAVVQLLPATLAAPLSATLIDRMPRRQGLIVAYGSLALVVGLTGVVIATEAEAPTVYLLAIVITTLVTLGRPAHYSALPAISGTPSQLVAANAATGTLEGLGVLLGPAAVALAAGFGSLWLMFLLLGLVLGLSALALVGLKGEASGDNNPVPARESFLASLILGVVEVQRIPGALTLLLLIGMGFVLQGALDVLGVAFAKDVLAAGETGASLLAGANGLGLLLGAAATVALVGRSSLVPMFVCASLLTGVFMAAVGSAEQLLVAALFVVCSGCTRAFADVAGNTLLHRNVSERAMARVFGIQEAVLNGGMALGAAIAPVAVLMVGAREAFFWVGMTLPVFALIGCRIASPLDRSGQRQAAELALLKALPLFRPLHADTLEWLATSVERHRVPGGCEVVRQGQPGDRFYVIRAGSVRVIKDGCEVDRITAGGSFGEMAMLYDTYRNATVETLEPTVLLSLEREVFLHAVSGLRPAQASAEFAANSGQIEGNESGWVRVNPDLDTTGQGK